MTNDSFDQYEQALAFKFHDWHPPIMAFIWHYTDLLVTGPAGLLIVNAFLYWGGLYLVGQSLKGRRALSYFAVFVGFLPMCLATLGHIWKDTMHAVTWLFAVGFFAGFKESRPRVALAVSLWLFSVGVLLRYNAIFGIPPLLWLLVKQWTGSRKLIALTTGALCIAMVALVPAVNYGLLGAHKSGVEQSLMLFDIGAISQLSGHDYLRTLSDPEEERRFITDCYTPWQWDGYAWGSCAFVVKRTQESGVWDDGSMRRKWLTAITEHPLIYIEHRFSYLYYLMCFPQGIVAVRNSKQEFWHPGAPELFSGLVAVLERWNVFSPILWFSVSLICVATGVIFFVPSNERDLFIALTSSAWLYVAGYLIAGVSFDFRYLYWSFLAIFAGFPCLAACPIAERQVIAPDMKQRIEMRTDGV
jgi:hypothetical protein